MLLPRVRRQSFFGTGPGCAHVLSDLSLLPLLLSLVSTCFSEDGQKGERRLVSGVSCPSVLPPAPPARRGWSNAAAPPCSALLLRSSPGSWSRCGAAWLGPSLSCPPSRPRWASQLCLLSTTTTRRANSCCRLLDSPVRTHQSSSGFFIVWFDRTPPPPTPPLQAPPISLSRAEASADGH